VLSIGILTYSTRPRGSVVHATYLAEALGRLGHDVTLYALSKAGDGLYRDVDCPVQYLPAQPAPADADALISQRIREVADGLRGLAPRHHIYHAEDCLVASGVLSLGGELLRSPLVRTLHHWEHYQSAYLRECQRRSVQLADAVVCVSRSSQRDLEQELGRRCPIIGNGVDYQRFQVSIDDAAARRRFGLSEDDTVVLSVGGIEPRKNSLRALEAMAPILGRHPTVRWMIVGGASIWEHDDYRAMFRAKLAELEPALRTRIIELGQVSEPDLTSLYKISQILLFPSLQEGYGLCVLEAMAAKTAVVVSNTPPFTEYLMPSEACFVDPYVEGSIRTGVERLLLDPALARALSDRGAETARSFSWAHVASEYERLYASVLERPRTRSSFHEDTQHA